MCLETNLIELRHLGSSDFNQNEEGATVLFRQSPYDAKEIVTLTDRSRLYLTTLDVDSDYKPSLVASLDLDR